MKFTPAFTAALLALGTLGTAAPAQAETADPARVLIVGDSVAHASHGDYGWRYFSWKGLEATGASVDFVGQHQGSFLDDQNVWGGSYADPAFDQDHASRWGLSMWEMFHKPSATAPTIGELVAAHDPDVVVERLGVNDFGFLHLTAEQMVEQVRRFVAEARAVKPDVDVVVGAIPQAWMEQAPAYNAALPGLVEELSTESSRVVTTPVAALTQGVDTNGPAHPTTDGQRKLAASLSVALESLGIGQAITMPPPAEPETPPPPAEEPPPATTPPETTPPVDVAPTVRRPAKPRKVRAVDRGRRDRVVWRRAARADRYEVRCGKARRVVSKTKATLRGDAVRCKVRSVNKAGASRWVKTPVR